MKQQSFDQFVKMNYADQGKAFLNAYWDQHSGEAENIWTWAHKFAELDLDKKAEGCDLDEFNAHRFLETLKETKTVRQMRSEIKEADLDFNRRLALIEYCIWKYKKNVGDFIKIPQGGKKEEVEEAQRMLDAVTEAFTEADRSAKVAKEALAAAKKDEAEATRKEAEARKREAEAKKTEAEARDTEKQSKIKAQQAKEKQEEARARDTELQAAKNELAAALAELKAQEDAYNNKTEELKKASETGGMVSRNKAKNELAQHLGTDPLPLRRAKITQEAAVKKAEKAAAIAAEARQAADASAAEATAAAKAASKAAEEATRARAAAEHAAAEATSARAEAEESRRRSEKAKQKAEEALEDARNKVAEAEAYLQEVKSRIPHGDGWWLERQLAEKKKYLPQRKQG